MLLETRLNRILEIVEERESVTVNELMNEFDASESTIRRDLTTLHKQGKLVKVHGGAVKLQGDVHTVDDEVSMRQNLHYKEKRLIAKAAAARIHDNDFVFIDAGTTTDQMIEFIEAKNVTVVTNGMGHAYKLATRGITTILLGGTVKASTEAVVGEEALLSLSKYNFTKGFFGANGVMIEQGFTTPELKEALLKEQAIRQTKEVYILADSSKFGVTSSVRFGSFKDGIIITNKIENPTYKKYENVWEVQDDLHGYI